MARQNCWEFKKCGRQEGGSHCHDLGVCAASTDARADGIHGGKNAGRACWAVTGTLCGGQVQGSFASKLGGCLRCDFYQHVTHAEGAALRSPSELDALLR